MLEGNNGVAYGEERFEYTDQVVHVATIVIHTDVIMSMKLIQREKAKRRGSEGERERLVNKEGRRERKKYLVGQRTERSLKGEYESVER